MEDFSNKVLLGMDSTIPKGRTALGTIPLSYTCVCNNHELKSTIQAKNKQTNNNKQTTNQSGPDSLPLEDT